MSQYCHYYDFSNSASWHAPADSPQNPVNP
jgi:hypothetical protein